LICIVNHHYQDLNLIRDGIRMEKIIELDLEANNNNNNNSRVRQNNRVVRDNLAAGLLGPQKAPP
jgi:hypothetical protein